MKWVGIFQVGIFWVGIFRGGSLMGGNFPGGNFPGTLLINKVVNKVEYSRVHIFYKEKLFFENMHGNIKL